MSGIAGGLLNKAGGGGVELNDLQGHLLSYDSKEHEDGTVLSVMDALKWAQMMRKSLLEERVTGASGRHGGL